MVTFSVACRVEQNNCGASPSKPTSTLVDNYGMKYLSWNFASEANLPTLHFDEQSFLTHTTMTAPDFELAVTDAVAYWNYSGSPYTISYDLTTICCDTDSSSPAAVAGCTTDCIDERDDMSVVALHHAYAYGVGSASTSTGRDFHESGDPGGMPKYPEDQCLESADIWFYDLTNDDCTFEGVTYPPGNWSMNWSARSYSGMDVDCSDGGKEYPFYNSLVHELGHFLGLDHAAMDVGSVMYPGCSGCDFSTIQTPDREAVEELY